MRKLKTPDIFNGARMLKKLGLKEQAKQIAAQADDIQDIWAMGFDFVWSIFDAATDNDGEHLLYEFLAGPFEMTPEEVENLDFPDMLDKLKQLAEENNLLPFFKSAVKLIR